MIEEVDKISKDLKDLNNKITDLTEQQFKHSFQVHMECSARQTVMWAIKKKNKHPTNWKKTDTVQSIFFGNNKLKVDINNRKVSIKFQIFVHQTTYF